MGHKEKGIVMKEQMELRLAIDTVNSRGRRKPVPSARARWWFDHMRRMVETAAPSPLESSSTTLTSR